MAGVELSIILPTLNEAECIGRTILRVEEAVGRLPGLTAEIIVVDDDSADLTIAVAEAVGNRFGNLRVLRRRGKPDLGSAIWEGMGRARGRYLLAMDADLQHPPEMIPAMYRAMLDGSQLVVMSRYCPDGSWARRSLWREAASKGAVALTHLLLPGTRTVHDPASRFFMLQATCLEGLRLRPAGSKLLPELLARAGFQPVTELPYAFGIRNGGKSKMRMTEIPRFFGLLLRLRMLRQHANS